MKTAEKRARTRRRARIELIEFLRPDYYWPNPYTLEMAFQVLRWLIKSATGGGYVTQHQGHRTCAVGLMGGVGAVNGACKPILSLADLRSRFHAAILGATRYRPEVQRWRTDKGISADAVLEMDIRHYSPRRAPPSHLPWQCDRDIEIALTVLLEKSPGRKLAVSLNSVHRSARRVHSVGILVGPNGFEFELRYGFKDPRKERFDSEWNHTLAQTESEEPFLDTLARAIAEFDRLCDVRLAEEQDRSAA